MEGHLAYRASLLYCIKMVADELEQSCLLQHSSPDAQTGHGLPPGSNQLLIQ